MAEKSYNVVLTDGEAHAVGFALRLATRKILEGSGEWSEDMAARLESAYAALDTSKEITK